MMMMPFLRSSLAVWIMAILLSSRATMPQKTNIGVCYGTVGNNLPSASDAIDLFKQKNWAKIRLFDPNQEALTALKGSGIQITLGTKNGDIPHLAASVEAATEWFNANVQPHLEGNTISFISVGNEVIPGPFADSVPAAIGNLNTVLRSRQITDVKVTTVVSSGCVANSYPPSATVFSPAAMVPMSNTLKVLNDIGSPLIISIYPYFAYASDPVNVHLPNCLFTASEPVVRDGDLNYYNIFDAMVDGFYWAMEKAGFENVDLIVGESGWPSAGNGRFTSVELAMTYNTKLKEHLLSGVGTPKKPGSLTDGFFFALFNENLKVGSEQERNFGLFYPDMSPVYEF